MLALKSVPWVILVLAMKSQLLPGLCLFPLLFLHHCIPGCYLLCLDDVEPTFRFCLLSSHSCRPTMLSCYSYPNVMTLARPWKRFWFYLNSPAPPVWLINFLHNTCLCWELLVSDLFVYHCLLLALLPCDSEHELSVPPTPYLSASRLWKAFVA